MNKPTTHLEPTGRILFLSSDPEKVAQQLAGRDLSLPQAGPLRDDVSTDEISPIPVLAYFDRRLGRYPYTGFVAGGRKPIGTDDVMKGRFSITVAGKRYGKGSSREHSPLAEKIAGIRLVIAESFERIYRQNADNIGLFTSTDFGLIERMRRGEPIEIAELVASRDRQTAAILMCGGLLPYVRNRNPVSAAYDANEAELGAEPKTLFQKIIERHAIKDDERAVVMKAGSGLFVRSDWRFIHEYYTGMCRHLLDEAFDASAVLHEPQQIIAFEDHLSYMHRSEVHLRNGLIPDLLGLSKVHREFVMRFGVRSHGALASGEGSEGISHAIVAEEYALPGQVVTGTDSHTSHSGALGCVAFGVGTTDMAAAMVTGAARVTMPPSLLIELTGTIPPGVTAKDIALHLLAEPGIKSGAGVGKVFEFAGEAVSRLSIDDRATLTNMTAELGGFTGIVAPDVETVRFLRERRGVEFRIEPWMKSDKGASYAGVIRFDCSTLSPMVAAPGDPGNGIPLQRVAGPVAIDIAYGGSCTAGKREDFDWYHEVLCWAVERGMKVAPGVKLYLQFGTVGVRDYCIERGYLRVFEAVGAELLQPACGACANCGPGSSTDSKQVTVSAINRNFPGRSGPGQVWLASPPTVAASAIAGRLMSFDLLKSSSQIVV
jgi:3-isopropylmalate/(R)-2-methylmalate dehydratase large subunit